MRVLIIEDEAPAGRRLKKLLTEVRPEIEFLDLLDSVESSVNWLLKHPAPDLIFMDIQLADGLSFEIFNKVDVHSPVIFTTAFDEYSLRAFKVNSIDYLLKPISMDELRLSIEKYERLVGSQKAESNKTQIDELLKSLNIKKETYKNRFLVKVGDKYYSIPTEQIAYFYTEDKAIFLLTNDKLRYPLDNSLDELEKTLNPDIFFRLNRQYIARLESIGRLHSFFNGKLKVFLKPEAEHEVIVSRDKAGILKEWLDR